METLRDRHFELARRHLVTPFEGQDDGPTSYLADRVSGKTFTRAASYEGWGEGVGQDMYSINTYGTSALSAGEIETWTNWFAQYPDVEYFLYAWDEPGRAQIVCPAWTGCGRGTTPQADGCHAPCQRLAVAFAALLTLPGLPLIYCGDEVGLAGGGDPDNRRPMPWSGLTAPQQQLKQTMAKLVAIRRAHPALKPGLGQLAEIAPLTLARRLH